MIRSLVTLLILFPALALSATVNIGLLSFDLLIPPDLGVPGVNVFSIVNFTGDPSSGGFALPPDFSAFSTLTLLGSSLTLTGSGSPVVVPLGDISPGPLNSPGALQFPDTTLFESALFSGTLSQTSFLLSDGSTFVADSAAITAELLPSAGTSLSAGTDFAIIAVTGSVSVVPEPSTLALLATSLLGLVIYTGHRRRA